MPITNWTLADNLGVFFLEDVEAVLEIANIKSL
jgi:hypothetical protein